jgi:hypothetical protein
VKLTLLPTDVPSATPKLALADVSIIVVNPLTTSISQALCNPDLYPILTNPNSLLVVLGAVPNDKLREHILNQIASQIPLDKERVLFVDPSRAISALNTLKSDPSSSLAVQRYQDDFIASRLSTVAEAVHRSLGSASEHAQSYSLRDIRARSTLLSVRGALLAARAILAEAEHEIRGVKRQCSELDGIIELAVAKARHDTLGSSGLELDEASRAWNPFMKSLKEGNKHLRAVLAQLAWWKLPFQSDGVAFTLGSCFKRPWLDEIQKHVCNLPFFY